MIKMKVKINLLILLICFSYSRDVIAQYTHGKVVYERKTNLYKKFKDENMRDWIKEADKIKIDYFELYFNDSMSMFQPSESNLKEKYGWATDKNTVYQNYKDSTRFTIKIIWGEKINIADSLYNRQWKITESKRTICGYSCRKAIWEPNDSTKIYAWYCDELMTSTGPESFIGLPGTILGLATEDGGVVYFAKTVELTEPPSELLKAPKTKDKIYKRAELKAKLEKDFGKEKWGKTMIANVFGYW
jgi:GLPGLI family protein